MMATVRNSAPSQMVILQVLASREGGCQRTYGVAVDEPEAKPLRQVDAEQVVQGWALGVGASRERNLHSLLQLSRICAEAWQDEEEREDEKSLPGGNRSPAAADRLEGSAEVRVVWNLDSRL
jgi:hypothetical protein